MQITDRLSLARKLYTLTDSGLVQFGNARWASCDSVMMGNDDNIKETIGFFVRFAEPALI